MTQIPRAAYELTFPTLWHLEQGPQYLAMDPSTQALHPEMEEHLGQLKE